MQAQRRLISWQPVLTDHQAFTYQSLSKVAGMSMLAFVTSLEDSARKAQGWSDTQVDSILRKVIPAHGSLRYFYAQLKEHRRDVHLFGSPFQQPRLMVCMLMAMVLGLEFYLVSEPYSPQSVGYLKDENSTVARLKAWIRPLAYCTYVLCLRSRAAGIFAISRLAVMQYGAAGMPRKKIFPFGYFVPTAPHANLRSNLTVPTAGSALRLVYVGALIQRKGVDVLSAAVQVARSRGYSVELDVFGPGDIPADLQNVDGVSVRGPIAFGRAGEVISAYDFLVLPSRYDGWGVVVNEALAVGVPVVTSDATGAGVVARALGAGITFSAGDSDALAQVICDLADNPVLCRKLRDATLAASSLLTPDVAAQYMWDVIRAVPGQKALVPSPWYRFHAP